MLQVNFNRAFDAQPFRIHSKTLIRLGAEDIFSVTKIKPEQTEEMEERIARMAL